MKAEVGSREAVGRAFPLIGALSPVAAGPFARIAKNFISLALASGLVGGGVLVLNVLVARSFGPAEFGQYRFALAFVALFHTLYHLGVGFLIIRDVARDKGLAARALGASLTLSLTLGLLSLGLIALVATFGGYSPSTRMLILILAIAQLPYTLTLLCQSIFRAFERMEIEIVVSFLSTATLLLLVLVLLSQGGGVLLIGLAHLAASLVGLLIALGLVKAFFTKLRMVWDVRYFRYLTVSSIPFALSGIMLPVYFRIDIVLVSTLKDEASAGLYAAAFTLTAPIGFVADSAANAIFPPLARAFVSSKRSYDALLTTVWKFSLPILLCLGGSVTLLAKTILGGIFGLSYVEAAPVVQVLVWASILSYFNSLFFRALEASNRQVYVTLILGGGALMNVLLGIVLIVAFGIVGAALAFLVTQVVILLATRLGGGVAGSLVGLVRGRAGAEGPGSGDEQP